MFRNRPIDSFRTPSSGIKYTIELEKSLAAQWWGMELQRFESLDGIEQSRLLAVYQAQNKIEAVLNNQERLNTNRQALVKKKKRSGSV